MSDNQSDGPKLDEMGLPATQLPDEGENPLDRRIGASGWVRALAVIAMIIMSGLVLTGAVHPLEAIALGAWWIPVAILAHR